MDKKMVPEVRFKGFTADWEQRKLDKILSESLSPGTNGLKSNKLSVKLWGKGVVKKPEIYKGSSSTKYYKRHSGQIIYGKLDFLHGAFGIIPAELNGYESTIDAPAFDVHGEFNSNFLLDIFVQKSFYLKKGIIANGSRKAKRINEETFLNMSVSLPKKREQDKVNELIKKTSDLITLQQRQLDLYKKLKKGLLQKLFPKNGEKVPEVRFTNFHDDWEQLPFSKIGTNFSYGLNVSSKEYDGKNKYIRITDIDDSNHKLIEKNLTSPNANLEDIKDYQLKENDLLFARTGASVGKSYLYDNNDGKVFFAGFLIRMEINNKFDKNFVFQNTLTDKYQQFVKITSQRSGQPGINAKEYASFKIFISKSLNEQKMIGKLCFRLNNLINLQQDKLEELKFLKKYLLQNMFI